MQKLKIYHWMLLCLIALIAWALWAIASTPIMTINGVPVDVEYDALKKELLALPNAKANAEGIPVVYMGDYQFVLDKSWSSIMLKSIDSLLHQDYQEVVGYLAKDYKVKPIIEGRDSFIRLYNRERNYISEYNQNTEAFLSIIGIATDYADGALFEIDKYNYILVGYTSNWHTHHVHIYYYLIDK
jgi:hypothetical protein